MFYAMCILLKTLVLLKRPVMLPWESHEILNELMSFVKLQNYLSLLYEETKYFYNMNKVFVCNSGKTGVGDQKEHEDVHFFLHIYFLLVFIMSIH